MAEFSFSRSAKRALTLCALAVGIVSTSRAFAAPGGTIAIHPESAQTASGTSYTVLTATGVFSGSSYPASAINFQVDSGAVIAAGCSAYGTTGICQVNYPTAALSTGAHTITVSYAGDGTYGAANATSTLFVTGSGVNSIGITVPSVQAAYGASTIPLSATVSVPSGVLPQNLNQINFVVDGGTKVVANCMLIGGNQASCTANYPAAGLIPGYHAIVFGVPADSYYTTAQSNGNTLLLR